MLQINVSGLPSSMTERKLENLFSEHGKVFDVNLSRDLFSQRCKGRAQVQMEGHEAREAVDALDNKNLDGRTMRLRIPRKKSKQFVPDLN